MCSFFGKPRPALCASQIRVTLYKFACSEHLGCPACQPVLRDILPIVSIVVPLVGYASYAFKILRSITRKGTTIELFGSYSLQRFCSQLSACTARIRMSRCTMAFKVV